MDAQHIIADTEVNDEHKGAPAPASLVMSFGSGDISAQIASDQVQLGAATHLNKLHRLIDVVFVDVFSPPT